MVSDYKAAHEASAALSPTASEIKNHGSSRSIPSPLAPCRRAEFHDNVYVGDADLPSREPWPDGVDALQYLFDFAAVIARALPCGSAKAA
jgi:hypothetical protein